MIRLGVDTGGTFTDFILVDDEAAEYVTHKTPSIPEEPSRGLVQGLQELAHLVGKETDELIASLSLIVHGTTVATNAVLTGGGAKTALLTTEGFRDALQMRRGMREETLNNKLPAPAPLVPRHRRYGIRERVKFTGEVVTHLSEASILEAARHCREQEVEAIAICFLHSYANPDHERAAKKVIAAELPLIHLTTSHELLGQIRFYERVSTTALNAFAGPLIERYLDQIVTQLDSLGFKGDLLIMQSSGGPTSPIIVKERSAATLLSGPAAGPVAGAEYASEMDISDCLTVDMGGTSFDTALVPRGVPSVLPNGGWIARHRVALPMLAIHTIGAGGGSIAWIDPSGILRVGPQSAGASPGPACYPNGGAAPTCTDANLVLGYLNPDYFLDGRIRLKVSAAEEAIQLQIAEPLGVQVKEAAAAIFNVINVNMTEGIREVSVDQGEDPRDFLLVVGGGAGPIHAAVIASELGMRQILVPRDSAVFAAVGLVLADVRHDSVRAFPRRLREVGSEDLVHLSADVAGEVLERMATEGFAPDELVVEIACDLRYEGQFHEIVLPVVMEQMTDDVEGIVRLFDEEHERLYGWRSDGAEVELVNVRASARASRAKPLRPSIEWSEQIPDGARHGSREAYLPVSGTFGPLDVYSGKALLGGNRVSGPAIVELPTTTLLIPETWHLEVTKAGDFLLRVQEHTRVG